MPVPLFPSPVCLSTVCSGSERFASFLSHFLPVVPCSFTVRECPQADAGIAAGSAYNHSDLAPLLIRIVFVRGIFSPNGGQEVRSSPVDSHQPLMRQRCAPTWTVRMGDDLVCDSVTICKCAHCTDIYPLMRNPTSSEKLTSMTMTHSEKSHIRRMKAWPHRQECRGHDPTKKNLLC